MFSLPPGMRILDSEHKNILAPSKATSLKIKMFFHRRGFYRAEKIRCCTFFPFNLFGCKKGKSLLADFLVYPRFGLIKGLNENNSSMKGYQQIPAAVRTGISDEYFSSRVSYQIDSPRHIDSRAWARLNTPAIKEYHNQQYLTTGLYLQTCPALDSKNKRNWELFEASVELAASCIYTVYDSGQRVEFISTSESFYNLKQYPNECFEKAMDFLARVQPAPEKLRAEMEFSKEFGKSMTNIIFIISEPASTPCSLIEYAMKTGCSTRLLIVSDSKQIKTPELAVRVPCNIVDIKDIKNNSVILKDI
jgi:uncharacterized protein (DUF58 family)